MSQEHFIASVLYTCVQISPAIGPKVSRTAATAVPSASPASAMPGTFLLGPGLSLPVLLMLPKAPLLASLPVGGVASGASAACAPVKLADSSKACAPSELAGMDGSGSG